MHERKNIVYRVKFETFIFLALVNKHFIKGTARRTKSTIPQIIVLEAKKIRDC